MKDRFAALPCCIDGVDAVEADSARAFSRHTHDQFGIGAVIRGAQHSASGRGPVEARAGDVITVNPGEVHDGKPLGEGGRSWMMLYFEPQLIWQAGLNITDGRTAKFELAHPVLTDAALVRTVICLIGAATKAWRPDAALQCEELLLSVLPRLGNSCFRQKTASAPVEIARQRIDDDPSAAVSLQDLAQLTGLSRFQVLRGFVRHTGLPPHAYLMQRRLQQARQMIRRGMPLAQAACEAGFADQSHMNRLFVKTYGMTPGAFAQVGR